MFPSRRTAASILAALAEAVGRASRPLVSLMLANNETGVVQPVAEAAAIVHAAGGLLHVDAVQAAGRIACDIGALGADLIDALGPQDRRTEGRRRARPPQ